MLGVQKWTMMHTHVSNRTVEYPRSRGVLCRQETRARRLIWTSLIIVGHQQRTNNGSAKTLRAWDCIIHHKHRLRYNTPAFLDQWIR
jgi:hypothetical protein